MSATIQEIAYDTRMMQTLLWQHNDATKLQAILEKKQAWYEENHKKFWENWYTDVFDLRTANEFGCAVWSEILQIQLAIPLSASAASPNAWGFDDHRINFDNAGFTTGAGGFIKLSLEQKRTILRIRYFQLVSRGTIPECNYCAREVFGPGVYALDGEDMTITYVFQTEPTAKTKIILNYYDIMPRPAGVKVKYLTLPNTAWGFGEHRVNFNNAGFAQET